MNFKATEKLFNSKKKENLIQTIESCVRFQKKCTSPNQVVDDFLKIAETYKTNILDNVLRKSRVNGAERMQRLVHEVMERAEALELSLERLIEGLGNTVDPWNDDEAGQLEYLFSSAGRDRGIALYPADIREFQEMLLKCSLSDYDRDEKVFKKFLEKMFDALLFDLLKICFKHGLKISFKKDRGKYGRRTMFRVFVDIFEYCEYHEKELSWYSVISHENSGSFEGTLNYKLERMIIDKSTIIREYVPFENSFPISAEVIGWEYYEFIDYEGEEQERSCLGFEGMHRIGQNLPKFSV